MGWTSEELQSDSMQGQEMSLFQNVLRHTQPPIYWIIGALFLGVKQTGHEVDHASTSSAKVNN